MELRPLGRTGLEVSAIGLGCAQLGTLETDYALQIIQRALALGVTYFDTARAYWDSEVKLGIGLRDVRERVVISTKTVGKTREDAWRDIHESLERLQTDYLDNCHLHGLETGDDMDARLGSGGAIEALTQARDEGIVRHIGCTAHTADTLVQALERHDLETILVPMNFVNQVPLRTLIPMCQQRGVGVTIMKPLGTGLLPATPALKWLLNQPIATAVPGVTTLEQLEEDAPVGQRDHALTPADERALVRWQEEMDHVRCRICGECLPCPQEIPIHFVLGTDLMYDHHRTLGPEAFRAFPWSWAAVEGELKARPKTMARLASCTRCGACEPRCPYGLPIMDMLQDMLSVMPDMMAAYEHSQAIHAG